MIEVPRLNLEPNDLRVVSPLFFDETHAKLPTSPKQLDIRVMEVKQACRLNGYWHSRFPQIDWSNVVRNKHYVCFSAEFDNVYYAVAIWSTPIAANRLTDGMNKLELRRMAIANDAPKNTATRMLKIMRQWIASNFHDVVGLVSYQDTEVHFGTIYKADNWVLANTTNGLTDWTNRQRNKPQSVAEKIRWEYDLKKMRGR